MMMVKLCDHEERQNVSGMGRSFITSSKRHVRIAF